MTNAPDLRTLTDQQVVALALQGDEGAYAVLVDRYQTPVFEEIRWIVGNEHTAEDTTQEAFLKAFAALDDYLPELPFSAWILRIAHNAAIDHVRRNEIDTTPIDGSPWMSTDELKLKAGIQARDPDETPLQRAESVELGEVISDAIGRLKPIYRTCFIRHYVEDLPYEEISSIVGLPAGTIRQYAHRAIRALRLALEQQRKSQSDSRP